MAQRRSIVEFEAWVHLEMEHTQKRIDSALNDANRDQVRLDTLEEVAARLELKGSEEGDEPKPVKALEFGKGAS